MDVTITETRLSILENNMVLFINLKFVAFTVYLLFFSSKNKKLKIVIEFVLWLIREHQRLKESFSFCVGATSSYNSI